ncbi:ATP-binding protein [Polyangium sp. 15x6]|uniref:ATP-binding protein n=1 Tax=Polyangium sp. 15x6 TaxID=3042687 RepID=UPI00249A8946|nr:ATP-binding protein [Polyangium sp. 15x6]MDI3289131.1 ATP-binding protein [Polyangium sp. 15x6]
MRRLLVLLGRIRVRLLVVNLLVLFVPAIGLEFARIHERELLDALERDMSNQAILVRSLVEQNLGAGRALGDPEHEKILATAAKRTRTRIRLVDKAGEVVADSHADGPPEGPEPPPPLRLPRARDVRWALDMRSAEKWPLVAERFEVRSALAGTKATRTRVRDRDPGVILFLAEPIRAGGVVTGVVYVARSTQPVLFELYRIRSGLGRVLAVALLGTGLVTLVLAWSISRPLGRLSRAAKRIAAGERDVVVPIGGGGEIRELGESFASMKERLDARMRYISEFAADVAHEFKSPLTSIRGAAELLGEGAHDDPEARVRFLRNIELDVERLDRLVSRLLQLSRIEASAEPMRVCDLEALALAAKERASGPDQPVILEFLASKKDVFCRPVDVDTALGNLLDNAVRFSPPGEPVRLRVEGGPPEAVIRFAVEDRGPGVPPAILPRIFDRFFTTDADRDGTGLGLAIVKSVAEAHGGRVIVDNRPGHGVTFTLEIPCRR